MSHEIDLSKYSVRTDLIIESDIDQLTEGITKSQVVNEDITIDDITISKKAEEYCNKKKGRYITISFNDITDIENSKKVEKVLSDELKKLLMHMNILSSDKCLIIGLGNANSTPDSLGPKVSENIIVTKHLFDLEDVSVLDGYRNVSTFKPSVLALTGIETKDTIKGIISQTSPDFVIIVDALASSSISRVNKTIQLTDAGIFPGSGVGNNRGELSRDTLGIPVIAIGVPTVVDAVTIVSDTISYLMKKFSYSKKNFNSSVNKLKPVTSINYLKDNDDFLTTKEKKKLLGEIGMLNDDEIKQLIFEVLTPIGYNMMVTPKEVDFLIDKLSKVISNSINRTLHEKIHPID
mgnify:FL=1